MEDVGQDDPHTTRAALDHLLSQIDQTTSRVDANLTAESYAVLATLSLSHTHGPAWCLTTSSYSGLGGVVINVLGEPLSFFSAKVEEDVIGAMTAKGQRTIIQELEMMAVLGALRSWEDVLSRRRVVLFTHSEAVRGSFLKSWSANEERQFFFWLVAAWVKSRAERPSVSGVNRQLHVQIGCKLGIRNRKDELTKQAKRNESQIKPEGN